MLALRAVAGGHGRCGWNAHVAAACAGEGVARGLHRRELQLLREVLPAEALGRLAGLCDRKSKHALGSAWTVARDDGTVRMGVRTRHEDAQRMLELVELRSGNRTCRLGVRCGGGSSGNGGEPRGTRGPAR